MKKDDFLSGLKIQFEEIDALKLTMETKFKDLDTWDSLTRFSIIAFIEDDYKINLENSVLNTIETPTALFKYIEENIEKVDK
ncbi:hypothetical protein LNP27_01215 [Flavobacterium galactosidilyticum]|uniref:hypothetical protein n=1 Tax=Flavobacterium galactosidilyticum TaxID=2893886 RepID=UPI001E48222A|nr:hypothetical protein [Flavobacterium sp. F-340]UFH46680.1 hypothetical protein LNP27_01215 [Flavobacterium sp. F-340]